MTKTDTSPEAVERLANWGELLHHDRPEFKMAKLLRALSARVAEYEVRLRELEQRNVALGEAVAYAEQRAATLEAKLAKAVDVDLIEQAINDVLSEGGDIRAAAEYVARVTLAEIQTETKEQTP